MSDPTRQQLPRRTPGKALRGAQVEQPGPRHYHRDRDHAHTGGGHRHAHDATSSVGMMGRADWHLSAIEPAYEHGGGDIHSHHGTRDMHAEGGRPHGHDEDGRITWLAPRPGSDDDTTELAARPPTGDDADPRPATPVPVGAATPDAGATASAATDAPPATASVGSGGAAGAGRPADETEMTRSDLQQRLAGATPVALERPGQVAAGFGTSSGDVPFQAALMSVLRPAAKAEEARLLAEEMAHLAGLMRTAGQVAADYHAHGLLAAPGLLVGLRFQIDALLAGRGLAQ